MNKTINIEKVVGNIQISDSHEYKTNAAINHILNHLASKPFLYSQRRRRPSASTMVKIHHNKIESKSHIIKQYLDRSSVVESAFDEIDSTVPFGKDIILQNLNDLYFQALDQTGIEYLDTEIDIKKVCENSESILDFIVLKLKNTAYESANTPTLKEQLESGINVIVAYAFIECVILENPN